MRSQVSTKAGGYPELIVEDSPAPADVALLEQHVAEAAIAAAGVGEEQEFAIFARGLYDRLGYETVGIIENCPAGSFVRWYRKALPSH